MAITPPQVNPQFYMATNPAAGLQAKGPDLYDSWVAGREGKHKKDLQKYLDENKASLMAGNTALINHMATLPGGGDVLAKNIQSIVSSQNEDEMKTASNNLSRRGKGYAMVMDLPPEQRNGAITRLAINSFEETGDRDEAEALLKMATMEDGEARDALMMEQITLASLGDEAVKGWMDVRFGDTKKIREEQRRTIDTSQKGLNTRIDLIESAWGKIDSLVDEAVGKDGKTPNRTAISSVLVNLVKLQDPNSAVLEAEMASALNSENPLTAAIEVLKGKKAPDSVIKAVMSLVDPLSPTMIDPGQIRATASALVRSQIAPMQAAYEDNIIRSKTLTQQGAESAMAGNFGDRLFSLNAKFFNSEDDKNAQNLTYLETNRLRADAGLQPLRKPPGFIDPIEEQYIADREVTLQQMAADEKEAKEKAQWLSNNPDGKQVDPFSGLVIEELPNPTDVNPIPYEPPPEALEHLRLNNTLEMREAFIQEFGKLPAEFNSEEDYY
jgi:hypothetical protein